MGVCACHTSASRIPLMPMRMRCTSHSAVSPPGQSSSQIPSVCDGCNCGRARRRPQRLPAAPGPRAQRCGGGGLGGCRHLQAPLVGVSCFPIAGGPSIDMTHAEFWQLKRTFVQSHPSLHCPTPHPHSAGSHVSGTTTPPGWRPSLPPASPCPPTAPAALWSLPRRAAGWPSLGRRGT